MEYLNFTADETSSLSSDLLHQNTSENKLMGLFDQILGAVANPNQQGSIGQLGNIMSTVQQLSNTAGTDSSTMQSVLGIVGGQVRSALQQKRDTDGNESVQNLVSQFAGTSANPLAVASVFSPGMQQQVTDVVAQRTGLDAGMIQQLLPMIVPIVLKFLQAGANTQNPQSEGNPVLNTFLDADGDGDVDIADAMQMANRYMGR